MTMYEGGNGRVRSMRSQLAWPLLPSPCWAVVQRRGGVKRSFWRMKKVLEEAESRKINDADGCRLCLLLPLV